MQLADRTIDPRRASSAIALILLVLAALIYPLVDGIYTYANDAPPVLAELRTHADPLDDATQQRPIIAVLVDGLRLDEEMPTLTSLRSRGWSMELEVGPLTVSRPAYHEFFTSVPAHATGVTNNRYQGGARADTLADRVRAAGGHVTFVSEDLDWMDTMFGTAGDVADSSADALGASLDEALADVDDDAFLMVHIVSIDQRAHDAGVRSDDRRAALARGDEVLARIVAGMPASAVLLVFSDHGHIDAGGHGGTEPEVAIVPAVLVGAGEGVLERRVRLTELAPTLAVFAGLSPPRMAVSAPIAEVVTHGINEHQVVRRAKSERALAMSRARQKFRRAPWFLFTGFFFFALMGTNKRCFGFGWPTVVAPLLLLATFAFGHLVIFDRPLSFSSIDYVWKQILRLVFLGIVSTTVAVAPFYQHRQSRRRAAAICAWTALLGLSFALAAIQWSVRPWPREDLAAYGPMLFGGFALGVCVTSALVLGRSAAVDDEARKE